MARPMNPLATRRYRIARRAAWLALFWEAFWTAGAPAVGVLAAALAAGLLEVPQALGAILGPWAQAALLAAALALFLWTLRRAALLFRAPDEAAARRRLENDSGLAHRPLAALSDRLANASDPRAERLWIAWRRRMAASVEDIRVRPPRPVLTALDPRGLRAAIGIALVVGVVAARDDAGARLLAALRPDFAQAAGRAAALDVWIDPPAYTGKPPILLASAARGGEAPAGPVAAPVGSRVLAAVSGAGGAPELALGGGKRDAAPVPFERIGPDSYRLESRLEKSGRLAIAAGGAELAAWTLSAIPDLPPSAAFARAPEATQRDSLAIRYEASDDYGVEEVAAIIRPLDGEGAVEDAPPLVLRMPAGGGGARTTGQSFHDLTPHPWAGRPARIVLRATDAIGQTGESEPVDTVLPERIFRHPVARAVVELRRRLLAGTGDRGELAIETLALAGRPWTYEHDTVVFLALKSAGARLSLHRDGAEDGAVADLMWETALRLEEGELSLAARRLRDLERQLQEALSGDASDEEIERLTDMLREAIDEYLDAMAERMREQASQPQGEAEPRPMDMENALRRDDIQRMLDEVRDMAQSGARERARELLSNLRETMENLRAAQPRLSPERLAAQETMRQLGELQRRQRGLMDETWRQRQGREGEADGSRNPDGSRPDVSPEELARMQEQLRRALGEFMRKLSEGFDEMPQGFGRAERSMKRAVGSLEQSRPNDAVGQQAEALEGLREAGRSLSEALRDRLTEGSGSMREEARGAQGDPRDNLDPFGRRRPGRGYDDAATIGIPDEAGFQKARRIRDELRRRSGDPGRPERELEYIDRLLRRF